MTTITIHIDDRENAKLLEKMLKELSFVEEVEITHDENMVSEPKGSYKRLKGRLDKIEKDKLFKEIENPSKWQEDLRNEW